MFTQTNTRVFMVDQQAEDVVVLLRKRHWCPRIISDLRGPISGPVFSLKGDTLYMPLREEDKEIIPKAALSLHSTIRRAGYRDLQVIIGHEIKDAPEKPFRQPTPKREIDWGNVAEVAAKGVLIGMMGIVMVPLYALSGALLLLDPSYCIVLAGSGTVIELLRWNTEA